MVRRHALPFSRYRYREVRGTFCHEHSNDPTHLNLTGQLSSVESNRIGDAMNHRCRHGFAVEGHKQRRNFFSMPQICVVPPIPGAQRGTPQWEKIDIVKITRVKKNKALLTWRLADRPIDDVSQNTPPEN